MMKKPPEKRTATGLPENIAGLLCYALAFLSGIVFLVLERQNRFVRFHAMQSILVFGGLWVLYFFLRQLLSSIPVVAGVIGWVLIALAAALWVLLMIKAYQGIRYKLPWSGELAGRFAGE
jgi:uncharacterized membrane protein